MPRHAEGSGRDRVAAQLGRQQLAAAFSGRGEDLLELPLHRKDGDTFWGGVFVSPVRDEAGGLSGTPLFLRATEQLASLHDPLIQELLGSFAYDKLLEDVCGSLEPARSKAAAREIGSRMRLFVSGSAPLLLETFNEWQERTGHTILERYGMSETIMLTSNPYDEKDGERRGGTVGFPLPGVGLRVRDDQGQEVPVGDGEERLGPYRLLRVLGEGGTAVGTGTNAGDKDAVVVKYQDGCEVNTPGQCGLGYGWGRGKPPAAGWARQFGNTEDQYAYAAVPAPLGGVYATGDTRGGLDGNTSAGGTDVFLVRYDTLGTRLWTRQFGTASDEQAYGLAAAISGDAATGNTRTSICRSGAPVMSSAIWPSISTDFARGRA